MGPRKWPFFSLDTYSKPPQDAIIAALTGTIPSRQARCVVDGRVKQRPWVGRGEGLERCPRGGPIALTRCHAGVVGLDGLARDVEHLDKEALGVAEDFVQRA